MKIIKVLLISSLLLAAGLLVSTYSYAAELEEIVVTARKRTESLTEIPISITTFSSEDIKEAALTGMDDVSALTAGFHFNNQGGQQPGRYNTQLRFRGLNQAQFSPSFETGALFIDGVYVLNGGTSLSLMDIERIEVIKGPQAAYFGRNTFGGAVNMITRDPSLEDFSGDLELSLSSEGTTNIQGIIEGPLTSSISASLSARVYDKEGHYEATDGGRLGDEKTTSINGVLLFQPNDNLKIKLRAAISEDDDGAPAGGFIAGDLNDSCTGRTITTRAGQTANPTNYICGEVPGPNAVTFTGGPVVDGNTILPAFVGNALAGASIQPGLPNVTDVGMQRESQRLSAHASYEFDSGYSVDFIIAQNEQDTNWIRDFDLTSRDNWYSRDPQKLEDESYEIRLTSPADQRFRWTVGANLYEQTFTSSGAGGDAATLCFTVFPGNTAPCLAQLFFPNSFAGSDKSEVLGIFAALDFDLTDSMTLILEGRSQEDKVTKGGALSNSGVGAGALSVNYDKFLPRAIIRWTPNDNTNVYASYALGTVPGDINAEYLNADARERAQYESQVVGVSEFLPEETLDSIEIGWKQGIWNGRGQLNLAAYFNKWEGIKGRSSALVNETCDAAKFGQTGCDAADGIMLGDPAMVDDGMGGLAPFFNSRNVLLDGDADIMGFEAELFVQATDNLTISAAAAYAETEYSRYIFNFVAPIAGFSDMRGNQTPRSPKWSGNLSFSYAKELDDGKEGFIRVDTNYFGKAFVDESNLAYIGDYFLTNVRAGVTKDNWRVEVFANNLFEEDQWAAGARWTDFSRPTNFGLLTAFQGVAVSPQDRRDVGLRVNYSF